jgi:hypothetical protein
MVNVAIEQIICLQLDLELPLVEQGTRSQDEISLALRIVRAVRDHDGNPEIYHRISPWGMNSSGLESAQTFAPSDRTQTTSISDPQTQGQDSYLAQSHLITQTSTFECLVLFLPQHPRHPNDLMRHEHNRHAG